MKAHRNLPFLGLLLAAMLFSLASAASARAVRTENYDQFVRLRWKEKTLLAPVVLPNTYSQDALDFHRHLAPFVGGNVARAINTVDLSFQAAPFGTDTMTSREQAKALVQLGMLSHMAHFALANAGDPVIKAAALDMLNQLSDIADHFKLGWLRSQYQRIITEASDARFKGGASPTVDKYAATVASLYDYVANTYGIDGHWYFMYGGDMVGVYVLGTGHDPYHMEYFLSVQDELFHERPSLRPDNVAGIANHNLVFLPEANGSKAAASALAAINYYMLGKTQHINPMRSYEPLPEWHRGSTTSTEWIWGDLEGVPAK